MADDGRQRQVQATPAPLTLLSTSGPQTGKTLNVTEPANHQPQSSEGRPDEGRTSQGGRPGDRAATRGASSWLAVAAGMILLVILLVFILQNLQEVKVSFFTVHWRAPLAVDLLFATVLGGLVVFTAGSVRIIQLRRIARRHLHNDQHDARHAPGDVHGDDGHSRGPQRS